MSVPTLASRSIHSRLLAINLLSISVTLLLVMIAMLASEYVLGRKGMTQALGVQARILAANSTAAVVFGDAEAGAEILSALRNSPVVYRAEIRTGAGQPFTRYTGAGNPVYEEPFAELPATGSGNVSRFFDVLVHEEIVHEGRAVGMLYLQASFTSLYGMLLLHALALAVFTLLAIGASYVLTRRMQQDVTAPLLHLTEASRYIANEGDYRLRVPVESTDEIGDLALSLNDMLDQIQKRDSELARELIERRRAEDRLDRLAHFDTVTNLPNRYYFNERLTAAVTHANRFGEPVALMFIDLDDFKVVNDTLGHHLGDVLLGMVAIRLQRALRTGDTVCRVGGDEFAVILENQGDRVQLERIAAKCIESVSGTVEVDGHEVYIGVSIGVSVCPQDTDTMQDLFKNADVAMYHAKAAGKNTFRMFLPEMRDKAQKRLSLETRLRHAVERGDFVLHYQPQIDLAAGTVAGVEALIRWRHPELGLISPAEFIPVAEETGLILPIGEWVMRAACEQAQAWRTQGLKDLWVAINLSARQFRDDEIVAKLQGVLRETGLDPSLLELELTESLLMEVGAGTIEKLSAFRKLGVHLSIDDFGTGYSSMSYLKRFPIHKLKVDRSFVRDLPGDRDDAAITTAIVAMARGLGLKVTAEGVETAEQADFLAKQGCTFCQGYFFAKPLPAEAIAPFVREWNRRGEVAGDDAVGTVQEPLH